MKKDSISINGTVQAYLLNRAGQVDGLLLSDGKQLHLPPHLSATLQEAVKPGDTIDALVEPGEESPLGEEFRTKSLTNTQTNQTVTDQPPSPPPTPGQPMHVEGIVANWLVGHKGEPKGFILSDGTYLHVPPQVGKPLTARVKTGDQLSAQGYGTRNDFGTSLEVETLELNGQPLAELNSKGAQHHQKAADHHEQAANHHRKAAKHAEAGENEKAVHHARQAHEHHIHATKHADKVDKQHASDGGDKES